MRSRFFFLTLIYVRHSGKTGYLVEGAKHVTRRRLARYADQNLAWASFDGLSGCR